MLQIFQHVLLDLPGLAFFTTYALLVLFWAEIYYQVCLTGYWSVLISFRSHLVMLPYFVSLKWGMTGACNIHWWAKTYFLHNQWSRVCHTGNISPALLGHHVDGVSTSHIHFKHWTFLNFSITRQEANFVKNNLRNLPICERKLASYSTYIEIVFWFVNCDLIWANKNKSNQNEQKLRDCQFLKKTCKFEVLY